MKRIGSLLLVISLLAMLLSGCGKSQTENTTTTADGATTTQDANVTTTIGDVDTTNGNVSTTAQNGKTTSTKTDSVSGDATTASKGTTTSTKVSATTTTKTPVGANTWIPGVSTYKDVSYVIRQEAVDLKLTKEVLERSVLHAGNDARLAAFVKKAIRGEEIVIGCIGGSITQGASATSASNRYVNRFVAWFKETFPNTPVELKNAGIGGTDSLMGVHRAQNDLLKYNPDLVFVEYSVNDRPEDLFSESYEGLMRKILKTDAAVIAIQMMDIYGHNTAAQHTPISQHYDIPTISYKNALWPNENTKLYQWEEISPDSIHPNNTGHAIVSELLINYVNTVRAKITKAAEPSTTLPAAKTENKYEDAILLNSTNSTPTKLGAFTANPSTPIFPNGWQVSGGAYETFTFEVENAENLHLLYLKKKGSSGTAIVRLNGQLIETLKSDTTESDKSYTLELKSGSLSEKDTISIMCNGTFWILGILKS